MHTFGRQNLGKSSSYCNKFKLTWYNVSFVYGNYILIGELHYLLTYADKQY